MRRLPDAANTTVPVGLGIEGSIASRPTAVFCAGLLLTSVLVARGTLAGILIGVVVTTLLAVVVEAIAQVGPSNGTNPSGVGFVSWVVLHAATGRTRTIHPLMWVVAVAYFAVGPISARPRPRCEQVPLRLTAVRAPGTVVSDG